MHEQSCVITNTYNDQHLPSNGKLDARDWSKFAKRLRKKFPQTLRILAVGEYGEKSGRAHYHAIIFGTDLLGGAHALTGEINGATQYINPELERLWGMGNTRIGRVNPSSAAYVASYCFKKHGQKNNSLAYPKRPALARPWFDKHLEELERLGFCTLDGTKVTIPKVYFEWAKGRLDHWKDKQLEVATKRDIGISRDTRRHQAQNKAANLIARLGLKRGGSI